MNEQEKVKKLEEIMGNPEMIVPIAAATDTKDRKAIFESYGLHLSEEEVNTFSRLMEETGDQELSESELAAVSGGGALGSWIMKKALDFAWNNMVKSCKMAWQTGKMAARKK